jgi:transposase
MQSEEKTRLRWVKLYEETLDAELVCLRCGLSRPTLEKWLRRYRKFGEEGLKSLSHRPGVFPKRKVTAQHEQWILELRKRRLGTRRIQNELKREYDCSLSRETLHKVLTKNNVKPLIATRRVRKSFKRYERAIPGDRIQIDTCKIAPGFINTQQLMTVLAFGF